MIQIEREEVYGWAAAIRGMRNSWNSWDKSDSEFGVDCEFCDSSDYTCEACRPVENMMDKALLGKNDLELMKKLVRAGTDHRKFMRMITVTCDITAPMYWWKEFDTYKVGTVRNSCSTMHTITQKKFTRDDFSHDKIIERYRDLTETYYFEDFYNASPGWLLTCIVQLLNHMRELYLKTKDETYWWQIIQLLPSSYNQRSTVQMNYEVLANMYHSRKNHRLNEWREFCKWIKTLPYSELITGERR